MLSKTQDIIWKYLLKPEGFLKNFSMFTKSFISGTNIKPWELKTLAFISNFCLCVFINESQFIYSVTCLKSDNINQNMLCKNVLVSTWCMPPLHHEVCAREIQSFAKSTPTYTSIYVFCSVCGCASFTKCQLRVKKRRRVLHHRASNSAFVSWQMKT